MIKRWLTKHRWQGSKPKWQWKWQDKSTTENNGPRHHQYNHCHRHFHRHTFQRTIQQLEPICPTNKATLEGVDEEAQLEAWIEGASLNVSLVGIENIGPETALKAR